MVFSSLLKWHSRGGNDSAKVDYLDAFNMKVQSKLHDVPAVCPTSPM